MLERSKIEVNQKEYDLIIDYHLCENPHRYIGFMEILDSDILISETHMNLMPTNYTYIMENNLTDTEIFSIAKTEVENILVNKQAEIEQNVAIYENIKSLGRYEGIVADYGSTIAQEIALKTQRDNEVYGYILSSDEELTVAKNRITELESELDVAKDRVKYAEEAINMLMDFM